MEIKTEVNAKKETFQQADALKLVASATEVFAAKGKKVVQLKLKQDRPTQEELLKLLLGPTGNLRAPTLKFGKKLIVGFNEEMYIGLFD